MERGLDYAPIKNKINEPELKKDFENFCRQMRFKWFFRNDPNRLGTYLKNTLVLRFI